MSTGSIALPNAPSAIATRLEDGRLKPRTVWTMLFARWGFALAGQAVFAIGYAIAGAVDPWRAAGAWWLTSFGLAEIANLWLLSRLASDEGLRLRDIYQLGGRATLGRDLLWLAAALVGAGVLSSAPNTLVANALWGSTVPAGELLFRAIPVWTAYATVVFFPIMHALTELPTYLGYVMPRLEALTGRGWLAVVAVGMALSTQHIFLPLLFDWRYLVWRGVMFIPFALWMAFCVWRRPTVLPYVVAGHVLLDLILPIMVLNVSTAVVR